MSDNVFSAPVTKWIQSRLSALYDPGAADVFDHTFSSACEVRANHAVQPLDALRQDLAGCAAAPLGKTSVAWDRDVVSNGAQRPEEPAVVTGAFTVARTFRVRAGPAQRLTHVRFSARVEQDPSAQDGDRRRVTSFHYTSVDRTPSIHFAVPHGAQEKIDGHDT